MEKGGVRVGVCALTVALCAGLVGVTAAQAAVRSSVSGSLLVVRGGQSSDRVSVACDGEGFVRVNGSHPSTGEVPCSTISEVDALMGAGNDRVNLVGVGRDTGFGQRDLPGGFGHGTGCGAALGSGNDRYLGGGSCFNLALAGSGNDRVLGGGLRDQLDGGAGRNTLLGRAGNDVLIGGCDRDRINAGSGNDVVVQNPSSCRKKPAPSCTPGYNPCIPPGSDVDCAGGSGNGPRYVQGPVRVTGNDPYVLDADNDGVGCES